MRIIDLEDHLTHPCQDCNRSPQTVYLEVNRANGLKLCLACAEKLHTLLRAWLREEGLL